MPCVSKHLAPKLHIEDASLADALPRRCHEHAELHGELGPPPEFLDLERRRRGRRRLLDLIGGEGRLLLLLGGPRGRLHGADRYTERRREDAARGGGRRRGEGSEVAVLEGGEQEEGGGAEVGGVAVGRRPEHEKPRHCQAKLLEVSGMAGSPSSSRRRGGGE